MKKASLTLCACLASFGLSAQPLQRGAFSTNASLQRAFVSDSVYVSAAAGSDSNPAPGPFATLTYAQSVANSNQTIYVADGTFSEYGLVHPKWNLARGVIVDGSNLGAFVLTNLYNRLEVLGEGTVSNVACIINGATNASAHFQVYEWNDSDSPFFFFYSGRSNTVSLTGTAPRLGGGGSAGVFVVSDQAAHFFGEITCKELYAKPVSSSAGNANVTNSQSVVTVKASRLLVPASSMWGAAANRAQCVVRIVGGEYDRNTFAQGATVMGTNLWFVGVSLRSTNSWPLENATNTHGTFYYEQERLLYSNP